MKKTILILSILALVGLGITSPVESSDHMPPAPKPEKVFEPGTEFYFQDDHIRKIVSDDGQFIVSEFPDGTCQWTNDREIAPYPRAKWENCTKWRDKAGRNTWSNKEGSLWPMEVGKSMTFDIEEKSFTRDRTMTYPVTCTVDEQDTVELNNGDVDAYKVVCERETRRRTYWYAPSMEQWVKNRNYDKRRDRTRTHVLLKTVAPGE